MTKSRPQYAAGHLAGLSELPLKALFATSSGFLVADAAISGFPIVFANPAFYRMSGASAATLAQFVSGTEGGFARLEHSTRTGEHASILVEHGNGEGGCCWTELSLAPVRDDQLLVTHLVGVLTEVTQRHLEKEELRLCRAELERAIEDQNAELEAINADLEGFTHSVSHDLRAPLRAVMGFSNVLMEDFGSEVLPEMKQNLDRINAAASRMATIIDDLLAFSRLGRKELLRRPINLSEMAHDIVDDLIRRHPNSTTKIDLDEDAVTEGDPTMIHMALENLIDNAYKFTSKTPHGHIEFRKLDEGCFVVRDNGVGFDPEYSNKLFLPFERLHSMSEFPGTGIGLANVRRIIERHGGHVWAEGAPNKGASFYFEI